jgi:STE24 endopeptidase
VSAPAPVPGLVARDRRPGPWWVAAVVVAAIGVAATVWRPLAPDLPVPVTDLDRFAPEVLAAVEAYRGPRRVVAVAATLLQVAVPLLVLLTPWGRRLVDRLAGDERAGAVTWRRAARGALVGGVLAVIVSLTTLPLAAWSRLVHDRAWGFLTQGTGGWLRDWTVASAGRWLTVAGAAAVLVVVVERWPRSWPARLAVAGPAVAAVVVVVHPILLQPLTLTTTPLADGPQRAAVDEVLAAGGRADVPVVVGDASRRTTRVNALVTGLGPTERIVLHDTLLELPTQQVAAVVAHELAHAEHRDLLRGVALAGAVLLPAGLVLRAVLTRPGVRRRVGARRPGDPRLVAVALVVLVVVELVAQPVANAVTRRLEAAADARAIELTGDAGTQLAATRVFTVRDLSEPTPPGWVTVLFRTHPSVDERVRLAVAIAERDGLELPELAEVEAAEADQRHPATRPRASTSSGQRR